MKRWRLPLILLVSVVLVCTLSWNLWQAHKEKLREHRDQAILQSYSQQLKPGMTREQVESYLHLKGIQFGQICCFDEQSAYADIVKIDSRKAPWFCGRDTIYIALQFAAVKPRPDTDMTDPSDDLKSISIRPMLEDCL